MTGALNFALGTFVSKADPAGFGATLRGNKWAFVESLEESNLSCNAYYDGAWKKFDVFIPSYKLKVSQGGLALDWSTAGQPNPIANTSLVYHQGFKPTPADIGAVAVSGMEVNQPIRLNSAQGIYTGNPGAPLEIGHGSAAGGDFHIDIHTAGPEVDFNYRWTYSTGGAGANFTSRISAAALEVTSQGSNAASVARKDYVDGQVATRAPMAHTHTVAAITDLKPQDTAATANTLALRDASADVHARLLRATVEDDLWMYGAIAFRVNNSNDNYTRYCSSPHALREWMRGAKTLWDIDWRAYIEHTVSPMTEYHIPGRTAVITYLTADGNYRISTSNGAGGAAADRLLLDSSGNLHAFGGVHDMGQRVYSPNNQPHYSHNHTAAQGNSDIVAGGHSQVGTYMLAQSRANTTQGVGYLVSGAYLRPSSAGSRYSDGVSLAGTWKLLGAIWDESQQVDQRTALWIRVS